MNALLQSSVDILKKEQDWHKNLDAYLGEVKANWADKTATTYKSWLRPWVEHLSSGVMPSSDVLKSYLEKRSFKAKTSFDRVAKQIVLFTN